MPENHTVRVVGSRSIDSMDAEIKAFHSEHGALEQPPRGWVSVTDYSRGAGVSINAAAAVLRRQHADGKIEAQAFRVMGTNGRRVRVIHFNLNAKKK